MLDIVLEGPTAEEITIGGKVYLYFGGTNYLGMAARPEVADGAKRAIDSFGLSSSASRTSTGTNRLHLEVESALSTFAGTEDAVVLSSGYLAMQSMLEGLIEENDLLLLHRSAHPSMRQAVRLTGLPWREFDIEDLETVRQSLPPNQRVLVIAEGISALTGAILPLPRLLKILSDCDFRILIDDAHGLGVAGPSGKGTAEHFGCESPKVIACATLSKAFGAFGGCVLPNRKLGECIRRRSFAYICASPPSAADLGAALSAIQLVTARPSIIQRLRDNVALVKRGLRDLGLPVEQNHIPIVPIHFDSPQRMIELSDNLFASGILAPYINYPGSPEGGLVRLAVTASHTAAQIDRLLASLAQLI